MCNLSVICRLYKCAVNILLHYQVWNVNKMNVGLQSQKEKLNGWYIEWLFTLILPLFKINPDLYEVIVKVMYTLSLSLKHAALKTFVCKGLVSLFLERQTSVLAVDLLVRISLEANADNSLRMTWLCVEGVWTMLCVKEQLNGASLSGVPNT